jgi:ABC-2 type transport system permease protein
MTRVLTIAETEFLTLVKTKAFVIGIVLMPALMVAFIAFMSYAEDHVDTTDRAVAIIDGTGELYAPLARAAAAHNAESGSGDAKSGPHYLLSRVDPGARTLDDVAVDLSARIKTKDLFAFVELPAGILDVEQDVPIRLYSQTTSAGALSDWLETAVNEEIARRRFSAVGIDQALVAKLTARADLTSFGLVERGPDGAAVPAKEVDDLSRVGVPMFALVLMFLSVMTGAMHLLNAIIEEKMSKISEVLMGAVTPFQLLWGKLLGVVAVSLLLTLVYLIGGLYALISFGRLDLIDPIIIGWFVIFLVCASLMFGSIFLAIGSACSDLKDSQSMVQPAMMLILLAYLGSFVVMRAPESGLAVGLSFFPTMTPFAMTLRLVMPPGPPLWQVLLSVGLLMATTAGVVWAAGRIFRVGLLMQGKPPTLPELLKWVKL